MMTNLLSSSVARLRFLLVMLVTLTVSANMWGETWTKVTSAPSDWSGEYLIVYEAGKVAFNGALTTLDAASNTISVTISDGTITTTDAEASFTIAKYSSSYTIKSASGYYIGRTSNNNGLESSTSTSYENTISLNDDGSVNLVSGEAYLRYNATSSISNGSQTGLRFRYYKSSSYTNQKAICLYKKGSTETTVYLIPKCGGDGGGTWLVVIEWFATF